MVLMVQFSGECNNFVEISFHRRLFNLHSVIQNQYEFFVKRMGGPPLYSQRKGHPALIGRHHPFPLTHEAAERWLQHMQNAMDESA
ncbi:hypothetical protein HID58_043919 [Brassica napus]|uniref:Uncharacterized protein n=1 Tax=Brassica napus TaxID=3708 RepID=A0ABQ8BJR2_BRANA|nr:hypothetical protein HID58_043919 [Brassica napus]